MEGKSFTQRVHFFTFTCQMKMLECPDDSELGNSLSVNLPQNATEIVRCFKYVRKLEKSKNLMKRIF